MKGVGFIFLVLACINASISAKAQDISVCRPASFLESINALDVFDPKESFSADNLGDFRVRCRFRPRIASSLTDEGGFEQIVKSREGDFRRLFEKCSSGNDYATQACIEKQMAEFEAGSKQTMKQYEKFFERLASDKDLEITYVVESIPSPGKTFEFQELQMNQGAFDAERMRIVTDLYRQMPGEIKRWEKEAEKWLSDWFSEKLK